VNDTLLEDIERALRALREPVIEAGYSRPVIESLQRQLEWCRDHLTRSSAAARPGPFSMGLMATRELDMHGSNPDLAMLINSIEGRMDTYLAAEGGDQYLAEVAFDIADLHRDGKLSRKQAIAVLRKRFPARSDSEIDDAFARALFDSR
jgi:hypothetical protein